MAPSTSEIAVETTATRKVFQVHSRKLVSVRRST
jgi:hypothetical protein